MTRVVSSLLLLCLLSLPLSAQQAASVAVSFETMTVADTAVAFAPGTLGAPTIVSSSVANPSVITTATNHGLTTGQTVTIANHVGSTPAINGARVVTVLSPTTFSIPLNVTIGGTGGTALGPATSAQQQPSRCVGVVETGPIRYRTDGTNPTINIGVLGATGSTITLHGRRVIVGARFIRQTATTATVNWQCYRD